MTQYGLHQMVFIGRRLFDLAEAFINRMGMVDFVDSPFPCTTSHAVLKGSPEQTERQISKNCLAVLLMAASA